ncbi:MAG: Mth938-like domain-containing protein [Gammaproteobacteria bacterium]|nr:Mth938-like domain-containing protein [Gammaproteobacteria bacterium]
MQLMQDSDQGGYTIVGHAEGMVQVNGEQLERSCVVAPDRLLRDWSPRDLDDLEAAHLEALAELDPELVLLGVGAHLRFPRVDLLRALEHRGIGIEVMDTPAACRTYNLLKGDGRRVVAALLIG